MNIPLPTQGSGPAAPSTGRVRPASGNKSAAITAGARAAGPAKAGRPTAPAHRPMSAGWTELPSARLKNVKCADPFASRADQFKTKFGSCFNSGGFPCRLSHGAANVSLRWSKDPSLLDFDPYLVICAEGLCETEHPYAFASRACFQALIQSENGGQRARPLVAQIVPNLRAALLSPDKSVFAGALAAVIQLSAAVGDALNPHIHALVVQMNKRSSDRELAPTILKAMQALEENGGPQSLPAIKAKVPTYCSVFV